MEALQDVERLRAVLLNELQVRLPHIRADELDLLSKFFADHGEEPLDALGRTLNLCLSDEDVNLATYTTALTALVAISEFLQLERAVNNGSELATLDKLRKVAQIVSLGTHQEGHHPLLGVERQA